VVLHRPIETTRITGHVAFEASELPWPRIQKTFSRVFEPPRRGTSALYVQVDRSAYIETTAHSQVARFTAFVPGLSTC
jgi:predicted dithiol-disulfide oxidoreductase (DUF899 family)